jgi:hypothetical protein
MDDTRALVARYYAAFNAGDVAGMLDCLADDVAHHVNEGAVRVGKPAFEAFCAPHEPLLPGAADRYRGDGQPRRRPRGGGIHGERDLSGTDEGLPEARGQTYVLPAGGFFSSGTGGSRGW